MSEPAPPSQATALGLFVRYGNVLFRWRNLVFPVVLLATLIGLNPYYPYGEPELDLAIEITGLLVLLSGQLLRIAVVGLEYIKRGGRNKQVYADKLVTGGLFAHCRNPLYVGNILILFGLLVIHGNPWAILIGCLFFLPAYGAIVAAEERYLRAHFSGEYEDYCRRAPRWAVRLRGLGATLHSMRFNWQRVVLKEYPSMVTNVCALVAIFGYEAILQDGGILPAQETLIPLAALLIFVLVMAGLARFAKKRKLIRDPSA